MCPAIQSNSTLEYSAVCTFIHEPGGFAEQTQKLDFYRRTSLGQLEIESQIQHLSPIQMTSVIK